MKVWSRFVYSNTSICTSKALLKKFAQIEFIQIQPFYRHTNQSSDSQNIFEAFNGRCEVCSNVSVSWYSFRSCKNWFKRYFFKNLKSAWEISLWHKQKKYHLRSRFFQCSPIEPYAKYVTNQMKKLLLLLIHPTKSSFNIICFCFCVGHVCFDLATTQLSDFRSSKSNATYIKRHLGTKSYFLSAGVTML